MSARLELALDLLKPTDWRRFEQFASAFLVNEFPGLSDMSAPSGDGGRDAEAFSLADDPTQFFQYSVTADWTSKIRSTVSRLNETKPEAQVLVYASPKRIGADADSLKQEVRKAHRIHLEIRDKSYFAMRYGVSQVTESASESLAREIVDPYLTTKGVVRSRSSALTTEETKAVHIFLMLQLNDDIGEKGLTKISFEAIVRSILVRTDANHRMARLADAYTLMAFLHSTPDVQAAMVKIFSHGEIWLDTTIILPMLAEELLDDNQGRIQRVLSMTRKAGIDLFTTTGVLEELASHIHRALVYTRIPSAKWEGGIPFIFEAYVRLGRDPGEFPNWVDALMGEARPVEDLGAYIEERFGIRTQDLSDEVGHADPTLRATLDSIWLDWHEERRKRRKQIEKGRALDPLTVLRLAKHDTESYLGVVQRRQVEATSPLGYKSWWLTFDSFALRIGDELRRCGIDPPSSPVLSIDFLSQYLSLGPVRGRISKQEIQQLPLAVEPRLVAFLTPELLEQARKIRLSLAGLPERVVARKVRDHLDAERRKMGPLAERGTNTVFDEIAVLDL